MKWQIKIQNEKIIEKVKLKHTNVLKNEVTNANTIANVKRKKTNRSASEITNEKTNRNVIARLHSPDFNYCLVIKHTNGQWLKSWFMIDKKPTHKVNNNDSKNGCYINYPMWSIMERNQAMGFAR